MNTLSPPIPHLSPPASPIPLLPRQQISTHIAVWSGLLGVVASCPVSLLGMWLVPEFSPTEVASAQERFLESVMRPGGILLKAVIIAPLWEEVVFRGWLFALLRRYSSFWLAVLVSTGLFAVMHLARGSVTAINALAMGGLLTWLTVRSRSLWPAILCHAAFNFASLYLIGPAFGITERMVNAETLTLTKEVVLGFYPLWWTLGSIVFTGASLWVLARATARRPLA